VCLQSVKPAPSVRLALRMPPRRLPMTAALALLDRSWFFY
jgi:hypothetical protein